MYMNYRLGSGQQFKIHPAVQPAWQEIVDIFPSLDILARFTGLQVRQVKTIHLIQEELDFFQEPVESNGSYIFENYKHTIRVKKPSGLAYEVGQYINCVYACANYMYDRAKGNQKVETHLLTDDPDVEKNIHMMTQASMQNASEFWNTLNLVERTMYENDKLHTFSQAFEVGIAALAYRNGRVPLSCTDDLWFLDPGRVDHSQKVFSIDPFCAFALNWQYFEDWWYDTVKTAINESESKMMGAPAALMGRIFASVPIPDISELDERLAARNLKAKKSA